MLKSSLRTSASVAKTRKKKSRLLVRMQRIWREQDEACYQPPRPAKKRSLLDRLLTMLIGLRGFVTVCVSLTRLRSSSILFCLLVLVFTCYTDVLRTHFIDCLETSGYHQQTIRI
jgi:hypothetical protein